MSSPSRAIMSMPRSGIREIYDLAQTIPEAIRLEVGQPNFTTAKHICDAAAEAAAAGFTGYTPNAGIPELREAIAHKVTTRNGLAVGPEHVVVTTGGANALFTTLASLVDPGSEVLLSDPTWPNYRMMLQLLGIVPRHFPLSVADGWEPRAAAIEPHINERTKALIINSPSNPTGAVIGREVLEELLDLAHRHDLWVISDEVYDEVTFDQEAVCTATLDRDGRVVTIYSFSKTYAMTGWRIGYAVAQPDITSLIIKCQEPVTSCVNGPTQKAAVVALTGPQDVVKEMRDAYHERRDLVMKVLDDGGVPALRPSGAFYVWVDISGSGLRDEEFSRRLILERHVAVVPGTTFGPDSGDYVRVSLATATDALLEGVNRMIDAVQTWGGSG